METEENKLSIMEQMRIEWEERIEKEKYLWDEYCKMPLRANINNIRTDLFYVSIYPHPFTIKPDKPETSQIVLGMFNLPTILTLKELKDLIARGGRTFFGGYFLNSNYYKQVYGNITEEAILRETLFAWQVLYQKAIGTSNQEIQNMRCGKEFALKTELKNNITNLEKYFGMVHIFALDVDKKEDEQKNKVNLPYGQLFQEVKQKLIDLDLNTLLAYRTFSNNQDEGIEKFRLLFKTDVPIFDWDLFHAMIFGLQDMFEGYFDDNCTNPNRMYFGSTNGIIEDDDPIFGESVELDKFFQILALWYEKIYMNKVMDKDNPRKHFQRDFKSYMASLGINTINNVPHVIKRVLTQEQVDLLHNHRMETNNASIFPEYHFNLSGADHEKIFGENLGNSVSSLYYIYYRTITKIPNKDEQEFYEICMLNERPTRTIKGVVVTSDDVDITTDLDEDTNVIVDNFVANPSRKRFVGNQNQTMKMGKRSVDIDVLLGKCQLVRELEENKPRHFENKEILGINLNLNRLIVKFKDKQDKQHQIVGKDYFKHLMGRYCKVHPEETEKNWEWHADYNENKYQFSKRCNGYCKYCNKCEHAKNMVDTVTVKRANITKKDVSEDYITLDEARGILEIIERGAINNEGERCNWFKRLE
ncbi:MAG: hypothetical protein FWF46_05485 [Oscillospiraceae bacterium]|nr:hypothetical protein [Oscillospiraceae bacterium]